VAAPCPASQAQRLRPGRRGSRACPQHRNGAPKDRIHSSGGSRPPGNRPEPLPSAGGHPLGVPIPQNLVARGDLEGAAGVLERCRERLSDAAQEESRLGERVVAALASMRAQEELARAVERRERERAEAKPAK